MQTAKSVNQVLVLNRVCKRENSPTSLIDVFTDLNAASCFFIFLFCQMYFCQEIGLEFKIWVKTFPGRKKKVVQELKYLLQWCHNPSYCKIHITALPVICIYWCKPSWKIITLAQKVYKKQQTSLFFPWVGRGVAFHLVTKRKKKHLRRNVMEIKWLPSTCANHNVATICT